MMDSAIIVTSKIIAWDLITIDAALYAIKFHFRMKNVIPYSASPNH